MAYSKFLIFVRLKVLYYGDWEGTKCHYSRMRRCELNFICLKSLPLSKKLICIFKIFDISPINRLILWWLKNDKVSLMKDAYFWPQFYLLKIIASYHKLIGLFKISNFCPIKSLILWWLRSDKVPLFKNTYLWPQFNLLKIIACEQEINWHI